MRPLCFSWRIGLSAILLLVSACSGTVQDDVAAGHVPDPAPRIEAETLRVDFDALYAGLQAAHYDLFARRDRRDYDARFQTMRAVFDRPLTPLQARVAFQRFVAYGNVAHARIDLPLDAWERFRAGGGKAFPLYVRVDGDDAYLVDGTGGAPGLGIGDRLESVDGVSANEWLGRIRTLVSADNDYMAWAQVEPLMPLLVWLEFGEADRYDVAATKPDGRRVVVSVPALDRAGFEAASKAASPHFELDANARDFKMLAHNVAYLRPGPFYDNRPEAPDPWDATDFQRFLDTAFVHFIDHGATRLLIDLRDNPGGDNSFSDRMVAWFAPRPFRFSEKFHIKVSEAAVAANRRRLHGQGGGEDTVSAQLAAAYAGHPAGSFVDFPIRLVQPRSAPRFEGQVFVLVNRRSFSNAVLVAAIVQDYGFGKVLGEETADLASTYGAMETFTLPRTGIEVGFPKARILRPNGDPGTRGVVPDIAIQGPLAAQDDAVLHRALGIIGTGH